MSYGSPSRRDVLRARDEREFDQPSSRHWGPDFCSKEECDTMQEWMIYHLDRYGVLLNHWTPPTPCARLINAANRQNR